MKAWEYEAVTFEGEVYCADERCMPEGVTDEMCDPIFASSECDTPPVCATCGEVHDYMTVKELSTTRT